MDNRYLETNLFLLMESEREKIPHVLREDYIPLFIVKLLREKLCGDDESTLEKSNLKFAGAHLGLAGKIHQAIHGSRSTATSEEKWTDDSLLQEFADFEGSFLLIEEDLIFAKRVLSFGKEAMDTFDVDYRKLWKCIGEEIEFPSLELLYLLDASYKILTLSSYMMLMKHSSQIQFFQSQFLSFCFSSTNFDIEASDRCTAILNHFIQTFILSTYCNPGTSKSLKHLESMVKEMLFKITDKLISKDSGSSTRTNRKFLMAILQDVNVPNSVKQKYFLHQLSQALTTLSTPRSMMTLNEVIQYEERFVNPTFLSDSQNLGDTIVMMIKPPVTAIDVIEIISLSIRSPTRNWERILRLCTEWIQKEEYEAASPLKEIIKILMREGLSSKNEEKAALAFILARHCSLVAPKIFSRYEKWYSNMFENELYSPAKDPDAFNFLTNLFTQWTPFEPNCFLQVQATFWPYIPVGCRDIWSDYVSLAKVRVAEYNEVEGAMEFEPNPNNPVQYDVEMVIKAYENTRSMPKSIAHMWMFRKQYYLEKFLPTLLKKPLSTALSDARLRLIEVLNKEGKIPVELYTAYKSSKQI